MVADFRVGAVVLVSPGPQYGFDHVELSIGEATTNLDEGECLILAAALSEAGRRLVFDAVGYVGAK